jgi:hypothetical protein
MNEALRGLTAEEAVRNSVEYFRRTLVDFLKQEEKNPIVSSDKIFMAFQLNDALEQAYAERFRGQPNYDHCSRCLTEGLWKQLIAYSTRDKSTLGVAA